MNRTNLMCVALLGGLVTMGCSQTGPGESGSGGSGSGGSSSGGATGSGGSQGTGGSGSGGDKGSGGSSASGGSQGSGGATGSGGAATGGTASGSGGANTGGTTPKGGTTGSTGGAGGGLGGTIGKGGTTGSGGTTTSTGGTSAGGTGGSLAEEVVPDLAKGFYWEGTCTGNFDPGNKNCWFYDQSTTCPSNGINREVSFKAGGDSSKKYTVEIEVRGVVGTRCYKGGTRASTAAPKEDDYNNWWYIGGTYEDATGWWNTYELQVSPSTGDPSKDIYYFNGSDVNQGSYCMREASYLVGYTASFKVVGGGTMKFKIHDQNCKAMMNCGKSITPSDPCQPRKVDLSPMSLQPPASSPAASANQPPKNEFGKTYYPQWMWIVAKSVTVAP